MTPSEMEQEIKNLDARTMAIEQILPTLATREDLRLTTDALQHEIETGFQDTKNQFQEAKSQFQEAKNHADRLNEITREQIRLVAEQMATKDDLAAIRGEMATKGDLQRLEMATKGNLQQLQRTLSKQIAALRAPGRQRR